MAPDASPVAHIRAHSLPEVMGRLALERRWAIELTKGNQTLQLEQRAMGRHIRFIIDMWLVAKDMMLIWVSRSGASSHGPSSRDMKIKNQCSTHAATKVHLGHLLGQCGWLQILGASWASLGIHGVPPIIDLHIYKNQALQLEQTQARYIASEQQNVEAM